MGFGAGSFGGQSFGGDPIVFAGDYVPADPPSAVRFDPRSGDLLLDTAGRTDDMGTVEQQVALAFSAPRGAILHAPDVGHDFMTLPRLGQVPLDAEIDRRAKLATPFDQLLRAGTVVLDGVDKQHPKDTETNLVIRWHKAGEQQQRTTPVGTR